MTVTLLSIRLGSPYLILPPAFTDKSITGNLTVCSYVLCVPLPLSLYFLGYPILPVACPRMVHPRTITILRPPTSFDNMSVIEMMVCVLISPDSTRGFN